EHERLRVPSPQQSSGDKDQCWDAAVEIDKCRVPGRMPGARIGAQDPEVVRIKERGPSRQRDAAGPGIIETYGRHAMRVQLHGGKELNGGDHGRPYKGEQAPERDSQG